MEENKKIPVDQPWSTSMEEEVEVTDNNNGNAVESWMTGAKRRKISFARRTNVIARNDIIVNVNVNKIKVEEDVQQMVEPKEEVSSVVGDSMEADENMRTPCTVRLEKLLLPDSGISTRSTEQTPSNEAGGSEQEFVQRDRGNAHQQASVVSSSSVIGETQVAEYKREINQLKAFNEELLKLLKEKNLQISQLELQIVDLTVKSRIGSNDDGSAGLVAATSASGACGNCQCGNGKRVNDDPLVTATEASRDVLARGFSVVEDDNCILKNTWNTETSKKTSDEIVTDGVNIVISREEEKQLENTKVIENFDQVLRVLIQKRRPIGQIKWSDQVEMLKTLRLVCKTWKESVDRVLKDDPAHIILCPNDNISLLQFKRNITPCSTIITNDDITKTNLSQRLATLQQNMAEYPTFDSLLTGHLMIDVDTALTSSTGYTFAEDWNKFAELITGLLMDLGNRVLYLTVGLKAKSNLTAGLEASLGTLLMKWLHLTPNLKSLCMEFSYLNRTNVNSKRISLDRVPHLKNLDTIQNSGGTVLHQLLRRNQQVSRLCIFGPTFSMNEILDMDLQNLSEVGLLFRAYQSIPRWFEKLTSTPWQPTSLTLIYPMTLPRSLNYAVGFVSPRLKNKLDHISLELLTKPGYLEMELDLPSSLKQMRIRWCSLTWFPVNFKKMLKNVKLLESLELEMGYSDIIKTLPPLLSVSIGNNRSREERIGQFWILVNALGTAYYWEHLPKLRSVKIKLVIKEGEQMTVQQKDIVRSGMSTIRFVYMKIGDEADYIGL